MSAGCDSVALSNEAEVVVGLTIPLPIGGGGGGGGGATPGFLSGDPPFGGLTPDGGGGLGDVLSWLFCWNLVINEPVAV